MSEIPSEIWALVLSLSLSLSLSLGLLGFDSAF